MDFAGSDIIANYRYLILSLSIVAIYHHYLFILFWQSGVFPLSLEDIPYRVSIHGQTRARGKGSGLQLLHTA